MILHQQLPQPKTGPLDPWFAVHCESITLALCTSWDTQGKRIQIEVFDHPKDAAIESHLSTGIRAPNVIGSLISEDICKDRKLRPGPIEVSAILSYESQPSTIDYQPPPEYLLLNSLDGTAPAIMHTADPVFIAFADPATNVIRAPEHYRSSIDLTVDGWAYWWEDAQRAYEKLAVESAAAFGIRVPEEIRNQA